MISYSRNLVPGNLAVPHNVGQDEKDQIEVFCCIFIHCPGGYCLPSYTSD